MRKVFLILFCACILVSCCTTDKPEYTDFEESYISLRKCIDSENYTGMKELLVALRYSGDIEKLSKYYDTVRIFVAMASQDISYCDRYLTWKQYKGIGGVVKQTRLALLVAIKIVKHDESEDIVVLARSLFHWQHHNDMGVIPWYLDNAEDRSDLLQRIVTVVPGMARKEVTKNELEVKRFWDELLTRSLYHPPRTTPEQAVEIKQLIDALGDKQYAVREDARKSLIAYGRKIIPVLVAVAGNHSDPEVQQCAAEIMGQLKDEQAIEYLVEHNRLDRDCFFLLGALRLCLTVDKDKQKEIAARLKAISNGDIDLFRKDGSLDISKEKTIAVLNWLAENDLYRNWDEENYRWTLNVEAKKARVEADVWRLIPKKIRCKWNGLDIKAKTAELNNAYMKIKGIEDAREYLWQRGMPPRYAYLIDEEVQWKWCELSEDEKSQAIQHVQKILCGGVDMCK